MSPAIALEGLTKDYSIGFWRRRPYRALDSISLEIRHGEVFGYLGPNGAGKTTTLKLLMQLIYPTAGRAEILGRPVGDVAVKRRIGYVPEHPYFYDYLTAQELLSYYASLFGYRGADRARRVSRLLDDVGIGSERRLPLRKFSKGMLQRVGIAQALINDPEVLFLDEPMSGLDPIGRLQVRSMILALRDQGRTIFFSSHILSDAEAMCSRVGIMVQGRLVACGLLTEMLAFEVRGWEVVVDDIDRAMIERLRAPVVRATPITATRYTVVLSAEVAPEQIVRELVGAGARLVSVNPVRDTLEEFFLKQVATSGPALDRANLGSSPFEGQEQIDRTA